jgi:20S proteasome alpha/beta subunit
VPKLIWTACLLLPFCANATTIVVLQTKDGVLLGTDARTVSLHVDSDGQATTTGQICKIVRTPRTAIAVAGILGNHTGFDSASFLRQNAPEDLPLNQAADKLAREMIAPLGTVILGLAESAPDQTLIEEPV